MRKSPALALRGDLRPGARVLVNDAGYAMLPDSGHHGPAAPGGGEDRSPGAIRARGCIVEPIAAMEPKAPQQSGSWSAAPMRLLGWTRWGCA